MKLDEIVCWYQKKIGTYDKQQWEKTVEQKILNGFSSITLKNAKLKTELIDVDLVRGSTFPKAKPKQTLLTVIRFAILRYLFLPIYAQWWVLQTSPNTFGVLLFLYITQMINWAIYTYNVHRLSVVASVNSIHKININNNTTDSCNYPNNLPTNVDEHTVSITELLIPMSLSLLLSLIHSQIVATNSVGSGVKSKRRRFSNASSNGHRIPPTRLRRRKKLVKLRSQDNNNDFAGVGNTLNTATAQSNLSSKVIQFNSGVEIFEKSSSNVPSNHHTSSSTSINTQPITTSAFVPPATAATLFACSILSGSTYQMSSTHDATTNEATSSVAPTPKLKLNLNIVDEIINSPTTTLTTNSCINPTTDCLVDRNLHIMHHLNRKRNVNWHSPVHHYAIETHEKQQQTSPQTTASSEASSPHCNSSSSSSNNSKNNDQITDSKLIDDGVQDFYDHLISEATRNQPSIVTTTASASTLAGSAATAAIPRPSPIEQPAIFNEKRIICDDDGFESLNGKSSSGEEANSPLRTADASSLGSRTAEKQQLRFRLNAGDLNCNVTRTKTTAEAMQPCEITKPAAGFRRHFPLSSESNYERIHSTFSDMVFNPTARQQRPSKHESTDETDEEGADDAENILNSPASINSSTYNECTTSATEWLGVTTNSEECSYSSELNNSDDYKKHSTTISDDDYDGYDFDFTPTTILNPLPADRISCTIWDQRDAKKAQMTVLEISSSIIERVESMPETNDYIYIGIFFSIVLSLVPSFCRLCEITIDSDNMNEINYLDLPMLLWEKASFSFMTIFQFAFGQTQWERAVLIIGFIHRLCLTMILFTIFAVAERTFKQRFLYGKLFSHLTSSRRARKSNLPHFRLNKVRNIKTWLSVRSYLKKRGPQRSVDVIVSAAFIVTLLLLAFLSVEWLKDSVHLHSHLNLEALVWSATIGIFLLRFMTLGNKIHHKYRSVSVLITEQINLYLQIEQKPKKKEELMVSNSVLKLAADLLKELETPFKISGLSANPFLFTTIKVVILSALSGVLSEMLGFKLKLHKIKIK